MFGYKIKNNIVFFMLCWHISWLTYDNYTSNNELEIINQLIEEKEFKKLVQLESVKISLESFDTIKSLDIDESYLIEKLDQKINPDSKINFPQFIYLF